MGLFRLLRQILHTAEGSQTAPAACSAPHWSPDMLCPANSVSHSACRESCRQPEDGNIPCRAAGQLMQGRPSSPLRCSALLPPPPVPASIVCHDVR